MAIRFLLLCLSTFILFTVVSATEKRELRGVVVFYCVAYDKVPKAKLQKAINYVCSQGVNCNIIKPGGSCYTPNTLVFHASAVLNEYYKAHGAQGKYCSEGPLKNVGLLSFTNPSQGTCIFR